MLPQEQRRLRAQAKTPDPPADKQRLNGNLLDGSPGTPGTIAPFDWDEFEQRYQGALDDANKTEEQILEEFERLIQYFNVWASAARDHDAQRAVKRLHTREMHVRNSEMTLAQKKEHYTEVVKAFKKYSWLGKEIALHVEYGEVLKAELLAFYEAHFSDSASQGFQSQFLEPDRPQESLETHLQQGTDLEEEEDDGLGCYADGVKRTLTDEQIAIFRHSEIEALRRVQDRQEGFASTPTHNEKSNHSLGAVTLSQDGQHSSSRSKKSKSKNKQRQREPKPDLRKRTWDVVEPGLDSLEYD
ncbi:hypothetical protein MKZ38_009918 [Zalerion maritima]|uniref:Uncharacterized protein n=1 Tax=Zalerion maritima TaxID=339359 RepID=A0AAD5RUP8_9PEZI|nr:hypothetical protein MKZ38_009918 [Zalerion maritima]